MQSAHSAYYVAMFNYHIVRIIRFYVIYNQYNHGLNKCNYMYVCSIASVSYLYENIYQYFFFTGVCSLKKDERYGVLHIRLSFQIK